MSKNTKKIKLPSMLSFERKLEVSDGLMFAGNWEDDKTDLEKWKSIMIGKPRQNRGTQSMFMDEDKRADTIKPNIVEGDDAILPMDKDTLKLSFTLRVLGSVGKPFACNAPDFAKNIEKQLKTFKEDGGMDELAFRYAYNIANGRFLWRNRVGAENVKIVVKLNDEDISVEFNAYDFSLKDFDKNRDNENLKKVVEIIKAGLTSEEENSFVFLKVDAYVKLGKGQHIFPSQEMNMGEKKKKLFQLDNCAAIHNVKIGNAIRTIDTWYGDTMLIKVKEGKKDKTKEVVIESEIKYPIAIEPYGSVTQHGRAYRHKDIDLYSLMLNWVNDEEIENDQKYFVAGNLIRGGVFGGDSEE